jgi:hypothetical protein
MPDVEVVEAFQVDVGLRVLPSHLIARDVVIQCSYSFPVLFPFCLSLFLSLVFVVGSVASQ